MKKLAIVVGVAAVVALGACSANTNLPTNSPSASSSNVSSTSSVDSHGCPIDNHTCEAITQGVHVPTQAEQYMMDDAYATFTNFDYKAQGFTEDTMKAAFKKTYVGTYNSDPHYAWAYTIPSTKYPTAYYHVFEISK